MRSLSDRLRATLEHQEFSGLVDLYDPDAVLGVHVGSSYEECKGVDAIVERYSADFDPPATFLRWDAREAPWGAVVEADATQGSGGDRVRFRWVHLLTVEDGRITSDTIYCSGATAASP